MHPPRASRSIGSALGISAITVLLAALSLAKVFGQVDPGYAVRWWTVDGGGTTSGAGAQLRLGGTLGQPDAGRLTSDPALSLTLQGGFWNTTVITHPLTAPIELQCSAECDPQSPLGAWMTHLTWLDSNADASDFHVFRSDDGAAEIELVTMPADVTDYLDRQISAGHTYTYRVLAHRHRDDRYSPPSVPSSCKAGDSADTLCPGPTAVASPGPTSLPGHDPTKTPVPSGTLPIGPDLATPQAPQQLACEATALLSGWTVQLDWTDGAADASEIHIERQFGSAAWAELETMPLPSTSTFTDTTVPSDRTVRYRVRAHRHGDNVFSPYSDPATCLTSPCEPELCPGVDAIVPPEVLLSALADPTVIGGFCDALNPSRAYHPTFNPRKVRLTLQNVGRPYHPLYNSLEFQVGCN